MSKRIYVLALAATLAVISPAAMAQQADPPKQSLSAKIKQKYLERREIFVRRMKDVYFAVGCKVLPGDAGTHSRDAYLARVREQAVLELKEDEELVATARQEGLDRAARPGACDYYRRHPQAAEASRRAAADAATR